MKRNLLYILIPCILLSSCSGLWGSKDDDQVNDILQQGAIDPTLVPQSVGYVPLYPFLTNFNQPVDVIIGYDNYIYVVDADGLHILDQKGLRFQTIPIQGATDVIQDRRLHTFVTGRVSLPRGSGGSMVNLAAVFHLTNTITGNYQIIDTLIHPDCDQSRLVTAFRGADDEAVQFTGLATLADNTLYISRTGPRNDPNSFIVPDNAVLIFDPSGNNTGSVRSLTPNSSNLRSALGLSSIAGYAGPPQRVEGMNTSKSFFITQADQNTSIEYRVLSIVATDDPDAGTIYTENPSLLNFDYEKGDRFLYEPFRFKNPEDCYISPDNLQYLFVVDSELDSLFVFTNQGIEGVNPPATYPSRKQVIVSFGGKGADGSSSGPFSFSNPSGVCYYNKIILVADKGNNRICRYILNTDLQ